jgi:uncharacterized hydrophobic protein (TIGR00341 family)
MAQRLIELFLPAGEGNRVEEVLGDKPDLNIWRERLSENIVLARILVQSDQVEAVLDLLESNFSGTEGFRVILLPVEASLPRPAPAEEENVQTAEAGLVVEEEEERAKERISREELYQDVEETIKLSWIFVVLVILSSVVAAIGLMKNNVAVIIGAMVIAPLLGPNVALSLSTTLGDFGLARRAAKAGVSGIFIAVLFSVFLGFFLKVNPRIPEIASRTRVNLEDIVLALAAGSAATLSFTTGLSTALIGVMVAVALLPPLVTFGLLLGGGYFRGALNALLLVMTNIVCINLSGIVTFLVQGIQPRKWWEADKARRATRNAIVLWAILLLLLAVVIYLSRRNW